uniref:Amino acid transporter n=1 Tax=Strigamia maritima TaxID=126957 RepID=T1JLE1_STRMM
DRIRTFINVLGDSIGAGIVNHLSIKDLAEFSSLPGPSKDPEMDLVKNNPTKTTNVYFMLE